MVRYTLRCGALIWSFGLWEAALNSRRAGIGVPEASKITGLSESTVRRWVDRYCRQHTYPAPATGPKQLKGWKLSTPGGGRGGFERRVDRADAERIGTEKADAKAPAQSQPVTE